MIFTALGSQKFPMDRLLITLDQLAQEEIIKEEVFAQTGHSQYRPLHFKSKQFLDKNEFEQYIEKCDLFITHAGSGSIMAGLKRGKKVIAVPRLKKFGEHVDDHQKELAETLSQKNYLLMLDDMSMLSHSIEQARNTQFNVYKSSTIFMVGIIQDYIESI